MTLKVLVACEYSGRVRDAFLRRGHNAMSCDLLPTDVPGPHYQGDLRDIIGQDWDIMVAHPPCTYLTVAGLHWNTRGVMVDGRPRAALTEEALDFVRFLMDAPIKRKVIENPVSCISSRIRKPDQIIQPYEFGADASKKTCLWFSDDANRPLSLKLTKDPINRVAGRLVEWPVGSGKIVERWANQTDSGQNSLPPSADRWKDRSETYPGIAEALAETLLASL